MDANDVGKILADGEAKRQAAWADQRLSEQGRAEAGQAIWAAAVASARETAAAVLAENDRAVAVAEQRWWPRPPSTKNLLITAVWRFCKRNGAHWLRVGILQTLRRRWKLRSATVTLWPYVLRRRRSLR